MIMLPRYYEWLSQNATAKVLYYTILPVHNADFEKAKIKCIYYLYRSPMEFMWCSLMPLIISELPINIHHELQIFF